MKDKNNNDKIGGKLVSEIVHTASQVVGASINVPGNEDRSRQGGYLVIREKSSGKILLLERIGQCPPENVQQYLKFAQEKGERLGNTRLTGGHVSSYQSRDVQNNKWGGAIVAGDLIVSFSGLKEIIDEAVVLVLSLRLDWITHNQVLAVTEISGYRYIKELYNLSIPR